MEIKIENLKECLTNLDYETIKNLIKNFSVDKEIRKMHKNSFQCRTL